MICEKCRRRFGKMGKNYWNARSGLCPFCSGKKSYTSFFISTNYKGKNAIK